MKYEPQIPQANLISQINANYAAASNYYKQRQQLFQKVLSQQANLVQGQLEEQINEKLEAVWQKNIYKVLEDIYFDDKKTTELKIKEVETIFPTSEFLSDYIEAIKKSNYFLFKGKMGLTFEKFIQSEILSPYIETASAFARGHLKSIVSGGFSSIASTVKGKKNIRPDLLVYLDDIEFKDENGVLYGTNNNQTLPLEFQQTLTIDTKDAFPSFQHEDEASGPILSKFLDNGNFFGFSAKVYNSEEDNKRFSSSSIIQKELNKVFFYPYNSNSGYVDRHSWEVDYAEIYVIWNLSRVIKTIISPTNIAMIYGNKFMWISTFLQSKVFYMNIAYQTKIKERDAGKDRIFPHISSPSIYTKNYNINKGLSALSTKIADKKSFGRTYKGIELILT